MTRPIHMREECAAKFYLPDRKFIECVLLSRECVPYVTRPIHMWETVRSKVVSTRSQVHRMCSIINENVFYHQWECVPYVTRPIHMWEVHRMCSIINENVFNMRQYPFICEKFYLPDRKFIECVRACIEMCVMCDMLYVRQQCAVSSMYPDRLFIEYVLSSIRMCSVCDMTDLYVRHSAQ